MGNTVRLGNPMVKAHCYTSFAIRYIPWLEMILCRLTWHWVRHSEVPNGSARLPEQGRQIWIQNLSLNMRRNLCLLHDGRKSVINLSSCHLLTVWALQGRRHIKGSALASVVVSLVMVSTSASRRGLNTVECMYLPIRPESRRWLRDRSSGLPCYSVPPLQ